MGQKSLLAVLVLAASFLLSAAQNQSNNTNTSKFTVILPPTVNLTSNVTDNSSIQQIQYWGNWTLTVTRIRNNDTSLNVFSPEKSNYYTTILMTPGSIILIVLASIFWFAFLMFLLGRFGFGWFGGHREKKRRLTRVYKYTPVATFGLGVILFFAGVITYMVGTYQTNNGIQMTASSLENNGLQYHYITTRIIINVTNLNKQMTYYTNNTNTSYFGNDPAGQAFVQNESWAIQNSSQMFADTLRSRQTAPKTFVWLFLLSGLIIVALGALSFIKKLPAIVIILGVYILAFVGAGWLLAAYSYQQQLYIGDICNQVQTTVVNNDPPAIGTGICYYIYCFSSESQIIIGSLKYNLLNGLYDTINIWKNLAMNTTGANTTAVKAVQNVNDIGVLITQTPYSSNTTLTSFYNQVLIPTYWTLSNTIDLSINECRYMKQWALDTQYGLCASRQSPNYVAFSGLIVLAISFLLLSHGLISAKNVFLRLREAQDTMISKLELNDL